MLLYHHYYCVIILLQCFDSSSPSDPLANQEAIDFIFSHSSLDEIMDLLKEESSSWSNQTRDELSKMVGGWQVHLHHLYVSTDYSSVIWWLWNLCTHLAWPLKQHLNACLQSGEDTQRAVRYRSLASPALHQQTSHACKLEFHLQSPTALKVSLKMLHDAKVLRLHQCFITEHRLGYHIIDRTDSDFIRGVTALLIDKRGKPSWSPDKLERVDDSHVNNCFTPLTQYGVREFSPCPFSSNL